MISCLILAAALQTPAPFSVPIRVQETVRMAITPRLDGRTTEEEWDRLAVVDGVQTYFQWQPNQLHGAASLPAGKDLVASFDTAGDGWLVGSDNLEVRISWNGGSPRAEVRILDATDPSGPKWAPAPGFQGATLVAAASNGSVWTTEFTVDDPGRDWLPGEPAEKFGIRMDAVPAGTPPVEPTVPRSLAHVQLGTERSSGLPDGMRWKPEYIARTVVPGDSTRIRLTFNGNDDMGIKRIEARTEGLGRDYALLKVVPFPGFDRKGRAFVDYETVVAEDAPLGFRLVRGTLWDRDGRSSLVECSYEVAHPVTFDMPPPGKLGAKQTEQKVRVSIYMRSNTLKRIDGVFVLQPPAGWEVLSGSGGSFMIYNSRGTARRSVELRVPPGARGSFPLKVVAHIGLLEVPDTLWLRIP